MAKKNKSYWLNRQDQWLTNQDKEDARLSKKLEKEYQRTAKELEKDIGNYFNQYGHDNVIEFRTMLQDLSDADRNLLFQDMDRFAEKYPQYSDLMPVRESIYQLNRLEGLHYSTQLKLLELGAIEQQELEKHLEKTYGKHYKNMLKELGIGNQFLAIDDQTMRNTLFSGWVNGQNFSNRIWSNKERMLEHMQTVYRDGLARGDNYAKMTKAIRERFEVGASDAKRLVWTESSFILNQAHTQAYQNAGVEEYEISAIRDHKTSPICREMDGERFRFDEMEVGLNFPPFHPYCRTTFIGIIEDKEHGQETTEMFKSIYDNWDGKNVKTLASKIVESEGLPLKVNRHKINNHGQCRLNPSNKEMEVLSFEINSGDVREVEYQIKTVFHELFHAKSNGVNQDINRITFDKWAYMDDVFAESTAHYITKAIGVEREISPSYAGHLIETLPRLKQLPEFKDCNSIADFGKVAMKFRYSDSPNAEWGTLYDRLEETQYDFTEFSKNYIEYIQKNKEDIVDKLLENMPQNKPYKDRIIDDVASAIKSIEWGWAFSGSEKMIFENVLAIAMNRKGVK
ncbi:minor capsid protein [Amphibacillus sp. MSJ-3]|uniref:minor capsid protein n=1 Tax=Amphibacillus sp. MSJ-3 TaxID=2841505 RepID=UPI001C0F20F0|nr:minor capsid protein [Amphibacillus sp. MSJ-3]MBU5594907.1 minor capsid protein [Amphibacillus sp. MSJ-3]